MLIAVFNTLFIVRFTNGQVACAHLIHCLLMNCYSFQLEIVCFSIPIGLAVYWLDGLANTWMHVNDFVTYLFVGYHIYVSNIDDDDDDECTRSERTCVMRIFIKYTVSLIRMSSKCLIIHRNTHYNSISLQCKTSSMENAETVWYSTDRKWLWKLAEYNMCHCQNCWFDEQSKRIIQYGSNEMHLNHHDKSRNQMMCIPLKMVELSSFRCCSIYFFYYFSVFIFASRNTWNSKNKTHSLSD